MLKRISEMNIHPQFDLRHEYEKIEQLFSSNNIVSAQPRYSGYCASVSIEEFMASNFLKWSLRGTNITLEEMRESMSINKLTMSDTKHEISEEQVLIFLQFVWNCLNYLKDVHDKTNEYSEINVTFVDSGADTFLALAQNVKLFLQHLKADIYFDEKENEYVVFYCDAIHDVIAEEHVDIAKSLIEYRRIDTIHDLKRKEEIICTLFKKFENIRDTLKKSGFDALQSDTGFLMNFARHSPHSKDVVAIKFHSLPNDEKEKWYDEAYKMFVACLSVLTYVNIKPDIVSMKKT